MSPKRNLRKSLQTDTLEDFIKEHEGDPDGDLDKLDAVLKRPTRESVKATPKASSQDADDD